MLPRKAGSIFSIRPMSIRSGGDRTTAGRTEEILGRWLKGKRAGFILATKCVGQMGPKPWDQGMSRKHILDAIDASLKRLQTDYVDLYQLHGFDPGDADRRGAGSARHRREIRQERATSACRTGWRIAWRARSAAAK